MIWIIAIAVVTIIFFAAIAAIATAGSSRDSRAEEERDRRLGADMCDYHLRHDEDGNEVLVTDPKKGRGTSA